MIFYTSNDTPRPVRLCENTRRFAYESLNHRYGLDTRKTDSIILDKKYPDYDLYPDIDKYDIAIREIAENAPIRICEGEKVSGAASLGAAISYHCPVSFKGEYPIISICHLTVDFFTILKTGYEGMEEKVRKYASLNTLPEKKRFYESALSCLQSFRIYHERYIEALSNNPDYIDNYKNLCQVPAKPARNFYEAVQSIWFTFSFLRLCGNWPGIGRLDLMLGPYLEKDLNDGTLSIEEAREILAHFFIKGCEWICGGNYGNGDAQHYQNLVLSGIDATGRDVTNEVTYLILDIVEELGIGDYPIAFRLNKNTDSKLFNRIAEVIKYGDGVLAVYCEDLVIDSLTAYGYPFEEAVQFANDGCWEVQIPGKTKFDYAAFDALTILQRNTLKSYDGVHFGSFEELYTDFLSKLREQTEAFCDLFGAAYEEDKRTLKKTSSCTLISLFENDCVERGLSYLEGGAVYKVVSPHIGGFTDSVNSLYALKKSVFDDKIVTFDEMMSALKNNWDGYEPLRQYMLNKYEYYGNDNDEVDSLAARLIDDYASICAEFEEKYPFFFPMGISTFGRQIDWLPYRIACPNGRKKGEILAGNCSPTPGTEKNGATAIIKSYCKADLRKTVTGAALDLRLMPDSVKGKEGTETVASLLRGFVALRGFFMQINVADPKILREAQLHPENYQTLSVRVAGWNARFVTLNPEWQEMVIQRAENKER